MVDPNAHALSNVWQQLSAMELNYCTLWNPKATERMRGLDKERARPVSNVWTVSQSSRQKAHITDCGPVLVRESHQQSQSTTRRAFWELNVSQVINPELRARCVEAHRQARKLLIHRTLDPDAESEVKARGSLLWNPQLLPSILILMWGLFLWVTSKWVGQAVKRL